MRLHHYSNDSVQPKQRGCFAITKDYYDGESQFIPARGSLVLVPCCSDDPQHKEPSPECIVITGTEYLKCTDNYPFVMFFIDNDTDVGLLLKTGDVLGDFYPVPHNFVRAQRGYMMMSTYKDLIERGRGCSYNEDEESFTSFSPPHSPDINPVQ